MGVVIILYAPLQSPLNADEVSWRARTERCSFLFSVEISPKIWFPRFLIMLITQT
jgi:hypothetical protein